MLRIFYRRTVCTRFSATVNSEGGKSRNIGGDVLLIYERYS